MKLSRKELTIAVVAVALLAVGAVFIGSRVQTHMSQSDPKVAMAAGKPLPVSVRTVSNGEIGQVIGAESAAGESQLVTIRTSLKTVRVSKVSVNLGDVVHKGDLVIQFDDEIQRATLRSLDEQLKSFRKQLAQTKENMRSTEDLYKRGLVSVSEMLKSSKEESELTTKIAALDLQYAQAQDDLKATRVTSPVSGIITERMVNPGMIANQGMDLLKVSAINPLHVTARVSEDKIRYIYMNQQAEVLFYAFPEKSFRGKIALINPSIEEKTGLATIVVAVDNPDLALKPGMNGNVRFGSKYQSLRVPNVALISAKNNKAYVFVVDDQNVAHQRQVMIGASGDGYTVVESGLTSGEKVVVVGHTSLKDNMPVIVK